MVVKVTWASKRVGSVLLSFIVAGERFSVPRHDPVVEIKLKMLLRARGVKRLFATVMAGFMIELASLSCVALKL